MHVAPTCNLVRLGYDKPKNPQSTFPIVRRVKKKKTFHTFQKVKKWSQLRGEMNKKPKRALTRTAKSMQRVVDTSRFLRWIYEWILSRLLTLLDSCEEVMNL